MTELQVHEPPSFPPVFAASSTTAIGEQRERSDSPSIALSAPLPSTTDAFPHGETSRGSPEATSAVEAAEEDGPRADVSTENLTVSVQVQVANGRDIETPHSVEGDEIMLQTSEQQVTSPIRGHVEVVSQVARRPRSTQTTLTSSLLPPPQPQLPNLALAALERLAENSAHKDDSIDDFRPLKKRKLALETEENCQDGEEVMYCTFESSPLCAS